jgi:hypothetical protein
MTTFVPFTPQPNGAPFAFSATFDGETYQVTAQWNVFGQRWYIVCVGGNNVVVFNLPLIGSPNSGDINLLAGYFLVSTLVFRVSSQNFEIGP